MRILEALLATDFEVCFVFDIVAPSFFNIIYLLYYI
nr:MAG TPA: hypothetical protein [Caudoviricetes sp.]